MKKIAAILTAGVMALSMSVTASAGTWVKDSVGWWYDNGDGTYQRNGWFRDGDGRYYYFNEAGYMLADTMTPDGYYVDASGAWVPGAQAAKSLSGTYLSKRVYTMAAGDDYTIDDTHNRYQLILQDVNGDGSTLNFHISEINYKAVSPIDGQVARTANYNYSFGTEYALNHMSVRNGGYEFSLFSVQDDKIEVHFGFEEDGEYLYDVMEFAR